MIDKSIRQHYQTGEEVKKLKLVEMGEKLMSPVKEQIKSQALPSKGRKLPNIIRAPLQRTALSKLGLGALNPILGLLSLFGIDPLGWAGRKLTEGGAKQSFTSGVAGLGFGSPQEGRELRRLETRRANMLQRKEEGRNYSEKNLDEVTREIAQRKGLDINNPNEMKNIDKPIEKIQIEKRITEAPRVIPKTPEIISPHLLGGDEIITPRVIPEIPEVISPHLEGDRTIPTPTSTLTTDFAFEDVKRAAQEKEEQDRIVAAQVQQAAAIKAENDRQQRERDAAAAAAARARVSVPVPRHISHGGGNGGGGQAAADRAGGSAYSSPFKKGGRVDKALGGRVRDI